MSPQLTCPTCRRPAGPRETNPAFPFCSERCRMVDLGRWLGEQYRIPVDEPASSPEAPAPARREDDKS